MTRTTTADRSQTPLPRRVLAHIRAAGLFARPGTAVLAVSGGPDSLSLLDLLHGLAPELELDLVVAHVDHGILPDSAAVAAHVHRLAGRYNLPAQLERVDLGAGASETRARRARYAALRRVQGRTGARYLVTAHHADDQIETVLYRLLKGSGIGGLAAIRATGPRGLVRPLLPFRRAELAAWLTARFPAPESGPPVVHDPSNADPRHDRSWIRVQLLPGLLERFGAGLERQILALSAHAAREQEAWAALLAALPELGYRRSDPLGGGREAASVEVSRAGLLSYEPALAEALLRALAREVGFPLGPGRSARLLPFVRTAASGRVAQLGQGFVAEVAFGRLRLGRARPPCGPAAVQWGGSGRGLEGAVAWGDWEIRWRSEVAGPPERRGWGTWVTPGGGTVRALAPGDRLVPLGGAGQRRASRLLMEARVPRTARAAYPILVRGSEILWLPGVCRAAAHVPQAGRPSLRVEVTGGSGVGGTDMVG